MPTLVEPIRTQADQRTYFAETHKGREKGSKNHFSSINIRRELERVYKKMGGFNGLAEYAASDEGRGKFYEWFVKIYAAYELKDQGKTNDPIKVFIYANDGSKVEIHPPSDTKPVQAEFASQTASSDDVDAQLGDSNIQAE